MCDVTKSKAILYLSAAHIRNSKIAQIRWFTTSCNNREEVTKLNLEYWHSTNLDITEIVLLPCNITIEQILRGYVSTQFDAYITSRGQELQSINWGTSVEHC